MKQLNYDAWLNGVYVLKAVQSSFSKNARYPDSPIGFGEENEVDVAENPDISSKKFDAWVKLFNEGFKNRQQQESDSE